MQREPKNNKFKRFISIIPTLEMENHNLLLRHHVHFSMQVQNVWLRSIVGLMCCLYHLNFVYNSLKKFIRRCSKTFRISNIFRNCPIDELPVTCDRIAQ